MPSLRARRQLRTRLLAPSLAAAAIAAALAVATSSPAGAHPSAANLQNSLSNTQSQEGSLQSGINSDNAQIGAYQGRINHLKATSPRPACKHSKPGGARTSPIRFISPPDRRPAMCRSLDLAAAPPSL